MNNILSELRLNPFTQGTGLNQSSRGENKGEKRCLNPFTQGTGLNAVRRGGIGRVGDVSIPSRRELV
ncbi:MAG: hypothetical protein ACD_62C00321G0001 [uncultured bacterium]|nr:MAG: hypothetical protein ACD_62C00321G0001 [uncultured bacterium]